MHRPVKEIVVEKEFISQLYEIFNEKMSKGDIQAEFYLSNSAMGDDYKIKLNLRQLFVLINALVQVPGTISVKEVNTSEEDNPFTRSVFLLRDGTILKDLTPISASLEDIRIRNEAAIIQNNWQK